MLLPLFSLFPRSSLVHDVGALVFPVGTDPVGSTPVGVKYVDSDPIGSFPVGTDPVGSTPVGVNYVDSDPIGSFSDAFVGLLIS